jgi:hypothetical protein
MPSPALLIGIAYNNPQAGSASGKQFDVLGSFRGVTGIIGILHRADGTLASVGTTSVNAGQGSFTIHFDNVAIANNYNLTILSINTTANPPTTPSDTVFPLNVS